MSRKSNRRKNKKKLNQIIIGSMFTILVIVVGYFNPEIRQKVNSLNNENEVQTKSVMSYDLGDIPQYSDTPYVVINNNIPNFSQEDYTTQSFEKYSELDSLGRCGVAFANISKDIMPQEDDERGDISSITPTGWKQKKYNGEYLYNRCHLIGYQLSNENANESNLITGTRYFNVSGMLPFENQVAEYIKNQPENENNHVLYRVTPVFEENNLLASRCAN